MAKYKPTIGIYLILNTLSGKGYIGQSQNIERRCRMHREELRQGTHHNHLMQTAWNEDGESVFEFRVMECCHINDLTEREQFHIDRFFSKGLLYNMKSDVKPPRRGDSVSREARENIRRSQKALFKTLPPKRQEQIRRIMELRGQRKKR